jgi:hypothetical protein
VRRSCIQAVALAAVTCQHAPPLLAHSTRALRAGSATGGHPEVKMMVGSLWGPTGGHPEVKMMVGSLWGPTGHAPSAVDAPLRPNTQVLISPPMGASWVQPLSLLFASLLDSWSTLSYVSLCPYIYVSCDLAVARARRCAPCTVHTPAVQLHAQSIMCTVDTLTWHRPTAAPRPRAPRRPRPCSLWTFLVTLLFFSLLCT